VPVFRAIARQVLVDVVVNKKNGEPVPALAKADFSIEEDGKAQTIDFFEEHSAGASAPVATPAMPPLPQDAITNVPTAPRSAALYVFLLDSLNTGPQDQVYARQQILAFLHKLEPGTQVAVFSLGSRLRLLQGFTSDPAALLAAVSRKEAERDAMAQTRSDDADDAQHTANLTAMRSAAPQLTQYSRGGTAQAYSFGARASMTFEALNALARYLQGIPGRKNLIWFSSSFPVVFFSTPAEMEHLKNDPNLPGYVNEVKQTANLFTLSKIAVYPVGVTGVMSSNVGMADSPDAGSAGGTGHFGTAPSPTSSLTSEALNSASTLTSMEQLAASTGGRAFATNDIDAALHRIVHDSDVYYTIGYSPSDATTDGAFRQIDVKVAGGRYKLDYRRGYNTNSASTGSARSVDPIAPLLQFGLPNATGILYGASATVSADRGNEPVGQNPQVKGSPTGPLTRYTISFTIRAEDIAFDQAPNGERVANLLVGVKAYGADGSALNWQATREGAALSPEEYASILKGGLPVSIDLDLPANTPARIVTAVYDWNTNRSGTLEVPLHP
jgi:VWFA-related protein